MPESARLKLEFCSKRLFSLSISNFTFLERQPAFAIMLNAMGNLLENLLLTTEVILSSQLASVLVFFYVILVSIFELNVL